MEAKNLVEMLWEVVAKHGAKTSLMYKVAGKYEGFSYQELGERVKNFALGLASLGVTAGDRIAVMSENRPEWAIADFGILSLGATNVPIYPTITPQQVEYILKDSGSRMIIVSTAELQQKVLTIVHNLPALQKIIYMDQNSAQHEMMIPFQQLYQLGKEFEAKQPGYYEAAIKKITPDDLCGIIYTSGTTGAPKGVMLSHNNLLSNVKAALEVIKADETDTFLSFLPLCHSFERMAGHFTAIGAGATIAYAESVDTVAQNLMEVKPTLMTSVPRLFEKIYARVIENAEAGSPLKKKIFWWAIKTGEKFVEAKAKGKVSGLLQFKHNLANKLVFSKLKERVGGRLRFFVSGGAPLPKEIAEFFYKAGILILEGYGLTETSPVIAVNREDNFKFGSVGPAIPGVEVKIAEDGEVLTRGPHVMKGYYKNPEATAETIDPDGWLHTGDIGLLDEDGFLYITDRKKNIIVTSGGKNITPATIENLLVTSPYIEQVMVVGDRRNYLTALIVPKFEAIKKYAEVNGISYSDIEDLVKHPKIYALVEADVQNLTKDLARFEQIKKFTLMPKEFTIADDELTPTLKIKRKVVAQKYADIIDKMYQD
ncbi:MAG: long-chain fatty acid--CoA ligase [candidate division KSB1 bacterium]|nr:long-chain fatty acid--CoA ligase [candidate division KSB1 bacterium]MDZ7334908.1 long-chain fatty acid--CoA ligase [candidate division KSB1 bacterium]MDZ7375322.1 long-chain fatty acid--CoA ligase [candidate division KSB1 bacterium]MDZ7399717.1 long-chain fatty acid--CoA ligase [candidate division KSB1 bacterium]